jgi:predicted DNA-binding transcriptional regulator YafY
MSIQSRQALRMIKFIAELKKNSYPNAGSFAKLLRKADIDENFACACSSRTIMRDIETLQNDYHAPIVYDAANRGYYLKNPYWEFNCPVMDDDILSMTLLGTRLASDILPDPIRTELDHAVEKSLTNNSSEFFDEAMIESLLCATGIKAAIEPTVFKTVFDAWRLHQMLVFEYRNPKREATERKFEPHIIAFHKGIWYAKGYDYGTKNVKSYAIQRITHPQFGGDVFVTDKKLLEATRRNGLFEYSKIEGVRLHCDASIAFYLYEHQKVKKFKIERQDDGSLIITLKPAFEHDVIRWVLGEGGHIKVLQPAELRKKVVVAAQKILDSNA